MKYTKRIKLLFKSIRINYIFCITYFILILFISYKYGNNSNGIVNFCNAYITLMVSFVFGWLIHYFSHNYKYTKEYKKTYIYKYLKKKCKWLNNAILHILSKQFEFHDKVHHDSSVNKTITNLITEFIQNIIVVSILFILLNNACNLNYNNLIILSYGFWYAITHNISYSLTHNPFHKQHHKNKFTNYGIDFVDILFGTKYNSTVEDMNIHSSNIIISGLIIVFIKEYNLLPFLYL